MQDKLNKLVTTKVCVVHTTDNRCYDGILAINGNEFRVDYDNGSVRFSSGQVRVIKGNLIYVY